MATVKLYSAMMSLPRAARYVGADDWIAQVRVCGIFPSRAAFARALIASKTSHASPSSLNRELVNYGSDGDPRPDKEKYAVVLAAPPGSLFVAQLDDYSGRSLRPWPPPEGES